MSREVHAIPPAPRRVRWRAVLWRRWPLALLGFLMGVYGGLWALMLHYHAGGKPHDDVLLEGSADVAEGRVTAVLPTRARMAGQAAEQILFAFRPRPTDRIPTHGVSFAAAGRFQIGASVRVEFLPARPQISRIQGTRISLLPDLVTPVLGLVVFPGLLLILLWLQGILSLKRMLAHGDVAVPEQIVGRRLRFVLPMMITVEYSFRDHHARKRNGHHWVREHSALGERLKLDTSRVAVTHARGGPSSSRLVIAEDFVRVEDSALEQELQQLT